MPWMQYDLNTGNRLATNSLPAASLAEGVGQLEYEAGIDVAKWKVDVATQTLVLLPEVDSPEE